MYFIYGSQMRRWTLDEIKLLPYLPVRTLTLPPCCVEVVSGSDAGRTGKVVEDDGTSNPYKVTALHTAPHSIEATGPTPEPHELFLAGALC